MPHEVDRRWRKIVQGTFVLAFAAILSGPGLCANSNTDYRFGPAPTINADLSASIVNRQLISLETVVEAAMLTVGAALHQRDSSNFTDPQLQTAATITRQGTVTGGTIDVAFGSATTIDTVDYSGTVAAVFSEQAAGAFTMAVTLTGVATDSPSPEDDRILTGSLALSVTHTGSTATVTVSGDLISTRAAGTADDTLTFNLSLDYDAVAAEIVGSNSVTAVLSHGTTVVLSSSGLTVDMTAGGVVDGVLNVASTGDPSSNDDVDGTLTWSGARYDVVYDCTRVTSSGTKVEQGTKSLRRV